MTDPTFDAFIAAWEALTDEQRERFGKEYTEALYNLVAGDYPIEAHPFYEHDIDHDASPVPRSAKKARMVAPRQRRPAQ